MIPPVTRKQKQSAKPIGTFFEAVLAHFYTMEDYSKIGLLDFQSKGGQNALTSFSMSSVTLPETTEFSAFSIGQSSKFNSQEISDSV